MVKSSLRVYGVIQPAGALCIVTGGVSMIDATYRKSEIRIVTVSQSASQSG